ncbi:MAG: hypothetical protein QM704_00245 [Anaeromyxobacteraceae bacterium]
MKASAAEAGAMLERHAEDAVRLWRSARRQARPGVFPGTLDELVGPFVRAVGTTLIDEREPSAVWERVAGVLRCPREGASAEHEIEWTIAGEVAAAVAEALGVGQEVRLHAVAAARACAEASRRLAQQPGPSHGPVLKLLVATKPHPRTGKR